jgi:hypothetical protein
MMQTDTKRTIQIVDQLLALRLLVGYLGQAKQCAWWDCNFLDTTGVRFLETTFPRTARPAALHATTDAACSVHDKALGRIGSYHLFRFPPALEDMLEKAYSRCDWTAAFKDIVSKDLALQRLEFIDSAKIKSPTGPVQVGVARKILTSTAIGELAAHYRSAFTDGIRCYPYFAADNSGN